MLQNISFNSSGGVTAKTTLSNLEVFKTPGQGLYGWLWESQYKQLLEGIPTPLKFGQYGTNAANGSTPQDTILSYSGTTTEPVVILYAYKFSNEDLAKGTAYQIEQIVNKNIGPRYEDGKSKETFHTTVEIIKEQVNKVLFNSNRLDSYSPRIRQQEAIDKMVEFFSNGGENFLLGAIMRYGKNFTFLTASKKLLTDKENILVLTNKPGVFDSLRKDIESHVYFEGWEFIQLRDEKDKENLVLDPNKVSVLAVSKQLADNKVSGQATREVLTSNKFKTAFFDECHSGTDTETFKELLSILDIDYKVWASGTPFNTIASMGFDIRNSYMYGYVEQQEDKKAGLVPDAVTLETYVPAIREEFLFNAAFSDEEGFTLTKLLSVGKNGEFIFGGEVREFISDLLGLSNGKSKYSPYRIKQSNLDNTIWLLPPDVKMAEALGKLIEDLTDEYKVIVASGNNVKNIKVVHDAIALGKKTITLTNMRFIEGTTVPEWSGAIVLSDTESVEKYFQFIFRVASPNKGKDKAVVFDYSPQRVFQMVYEFANNQALNTERTDTQEIIKEWLDNYNVYRAGNGPEFNLVEVGDVLEEINNGDYRAATLLKGYSKYVDYNALANIADQFSNLNTSKKITVSVKHVENGLGKGKNYNMTGRESRELSPKEVNELTEALKNIAGVISSLPLMSFLEGFKTVEELASNVSDEMFKEYTSVTKEIFNLLTENKVLNTRHINLYL